MGVYDDLFVVWKRERVVDALNNLDVDFYDRLKPYLTHLENQGKHEENDILAKLFESRWKRVNYILNDLMTLRLNKHFRDALSGKECPSDLPPEELHFRQQVEKLHQQFRNSLISNEQSVEEIEFTELYTFIEFIEGEANAIIGVDLKQYGPFLKGDIALLNSDNARNFIIRSKANDVKIKSNK